MKNLILFFIAILSLSQASNLVRAAAAPALMFGFWRLLGASGLMLLIRSYNSIRSPSSSKIRFFEPVSRSAWAWTALSGGFFFLHLWTFFYAAQNTTIAHCGVIFATNPLFTALGAWVLLKDRFEKRHALAFVMAFTGICFLVSENLNWEAGHSGDFAALASALFFSIYLLTSKKARLQMSTDQFSWIMYLWAALLFFFAGLHQQVAWMGYPDFTWWALAANILFPTLLGHVLFTHLLKYFNINWMSCGKLVEPVLASFVAYLAFGEALKPQTWIAFGFTAGSVLILFGPLIYNRKDPT